MPRLEHNGDEHLKFDEQNLRKRNAENENTLKHGILINKR